MRFALTGKTFWLWFGGIWLICGVPFLAFGLYVGIQNVSVNERIKADGVAATGTVLTKWVDTQRTHDGGYVASSSSSYWASFRFRTRRRELVKGKAQVDLPAWDALTELGPVTVTYVPDAPGNYRIEGQTNPLILPFIFAGLGVLFTIGGAIAFARGLAHWRLDAWLRHMGVPTQATVTKLAPANITINGVPQWIVRYSYQDDNGRGRTGKSDPMSPEDVEPWKVGDRGRIRFDPRGPQRSLWLGRGEG